MNFDRKNHWEKIYQTKDLTEVSWYQPTPKTSLDFFVEYHVPKSAKIIDIGGGDSLLVDHLLALGYSDVSVLDISAEAIDRAKNRLGERANQVTWIVSDIVKFEPNQKYDFWHDRATFHFLTEDKEVEDYLNIAQKSINPSGILVLGTFSDKGPTKCSGIEIKQYSETTMVQRLKHYFEKIKCISIDHTTPSQNIQNFIFCSFRKSNLTPEG